ncbi:MAG TPA: aminoglycoside 6-adenylyltransferase, partial [Streptomyces sp.]|nr:aminoglycoside 6-adenylyltransferase [Streptomyces sp.]
MSHSSSADGVSGALHPVPARLRDLAAGVIATAEGDPRVLAVIAAGSVADGTADEYSDLDLVLVCTDEGRHGVLADAQDFARRSGPLLVAFTGEHVGEPRLLIALYGPEPRHVDLKFIGIGDLDTRVEDGI